jgi:small-conductance mechanosensitive channel
MNAILKELKLMLDNIVAEVVQQVPNLILAIFVFFIGFLLAKIIRKLTQRFILYIHRGLNEKLSKRRLSVDLLGIANFIATVLYWIILLFTVALISQILQLSFFEKWFDGLINYLPNVIGALAVVFVGFIAGNLISDLIVSIFLRSGSTNGKSIGSIAKYLILGISVIIAIDQLGIDIAFLTQFVSIVIGALLFGAALAFGLGAKSSVHNILSSYYIQKTFEIGNTIQIDGTEGVIIKITSTSVTLETNSGQVIIPAKEFNSKTVIKT